ncbi:sodium:proton antiporter [Sciscionella sediminilitoris]|uniref:sodium:proton antiporter n=1 Tax=Sciscionella sediminilitoris TaxID=1445613 RepID=UPI0004DF931F|nr:cation:proton antiporter subunit C [Sciscionella sp. SE31]
MSALAYGVAAVLLLGGVLGMVRSHDLVHTVVCLLVAQSSTYVLLLSIGYQWGARPPVAPNTARLRGPPLTDPVVQAMALTDIVVSATVTALLLALVVQIHRRHGTVDPERLRALRG